MEDSFKNIIGDFMGKNNLNPDMVQPLVLAYIGDAVYDLYIRTMLVNTMNTNVNTLHRNSISFVMAHSQSEIIHAITDSLSEHELYIVKRGRNAKSGTIPKNANVTEYKYATGFEALIGYLYLKGDMNRLMDILNLSVNAIKNMPPLNQNNTKNDVKD